MKRPKDRLLKDEGGFTLPELLVTMLMMLTVMFALYSIFDMGIRVFAFGNDKIEAVENARLGLERMEREIRAAYPQGGGVLLSTWGVNQIAFQNRTGSGSPQPIAYSTSGGSHNRLLRNGEPVVEFLDGANGVRFTYCKSATDCSSPITAENQIRMVRITLNIRVPGVTDATQTLTTDVDLRNRQ